MQDKLLGTLMDVPHTINVDSGVYQFVAAPEDTVGHVMIYM